MSFSKPRLPSSEFSFAAPKLNSKLRPPSLEFSFELLKTPTPEFEVSFWASKLNSKLQSSSFKFPASRPAPQALASRKLETKLKSLDAEF